MRFLLCFFCLRLLASDYNPALFDLESLAQDFVVEAREIVLEEYPFAFNPSLIEWNGKPLLFFRTRDRQTGSTDGFGVVWLDREFKPKGAPQILHIDFPGRDFPSKKQEPRPIQVNGRVYLVFNNTITPAIHPEIRRMYISEMFYEEGVFRVADPECFTQFTGASETRPEKNWVPFEYGGQFLLSYSLSPHRVLQPAFGMNACELYSLSNQKIGWEWGELRGGSPALRVGDEYLAFFHSSINMPSIHSQGKRVIHYFMGAYTFSAIPPFQITSISSLPIIGKNFYHGKNYPTWKPLHVVFPGGFLDDGRYIWVVYGRQDFEMWVAKLEKRGLMNSLKSCSKSL